MKKVFLSFLLSTIFSLVVTLACSTNLLAAETPALAPTLAPFNEIVLGHKSYIPVLTQKLASPVLLYVDIAPNKLSMDKISFLKNKWGWAVQTPNEPNSAYLNEFRVHSASFYGGNGMNGNIGDGRTSIDGDENFKGIGPTGMVNPHSEVGHTSGTLKIDHAIIESIWSKLLDLELPYGANRVRGIVGTGTIENRDGHPGVRVVIVRDDFLRPAHFITNETSPKVARFEVDRERVRSAILKLPEALPQPRNAPLFMTRELKLKAGLNEFIDRFAVQTAYMWAHSMYHGAMSPSNVTLQGGAADFGTFHALGGYPSVQLLSDCSPNGDFSEELQVLKEFYNELVASSPKSFKAAIGELDDWNRHFKKTYELRVEKEMISLSGAILEFIDPLALTPESRRLAKNLIKIAKAGNEEIIQTWVRPLEYQTGTYSLPRILEKLASVDLNKNQLELILQTEVSDFEVRQELVTSYFDYYQKMNSLAVIHGFEPKAVASYRVLAAEVRNRKMTELFRTSRLQSELNDVVQAYGATGDPSVISHFIEQKVNASRRNFKDAAPFTVVTAQELDEKTGQIKRHVYDAREGRTYDLVLDEVQPLEKTLSNEMYLQTSLRCESLFLARGH